MPGFPNYFTMLGNNVSLAHRAFLCPCSPQSTSRAQTALLELMFSVGLLFPLEVQADYIATIICAMASHSVEVLEVKEAANERYISYVPTILSTFLGTFRIDIASNA
jgi:hypothetical protein